MCKYRYEPSFLDKTDPCVLYGNPIEPGSTVSITKHNIDPGKKFVFILDEKGNRQSVFKSSLVKIK